MAETKTAIYAGGCFWCIESDFDKLDGVIDVVSGYSGGSKEDAKYELVAAKQTKHYEVVEVTYDADRVSYEELTDYFWRHVDPLDGSGQFCDKGEQYSSAVFYGNDEEKRIAEKLKASYEEELFGNGAVKTKIMPAKPFYAAEDYHQDYYIKNPVRYKYYRWSCGRDARVQAVWKTSTQQGH
ncbi:MAG: peptide-methionine (S)-S-oxide reductase MsrA [Alphaproteobacteria bacterium]|nr:peptide-methionine (S)-S-oxide reductase MsrA [Alphaproteobacteria bacterium]